MSMEGELCLRHGTERNESAGNDTVLVVGVNSNRSTRLLACLDHVLDQVARGGLDHVRGLKGNTNDDTIACAKP